MKKLTEDRSIDAFYWCALFVGNQWVGIHCHLTARYRAIGNELTVNSRQSFQFIPLRRKVKSKMRKKIEKKEMWRIKKRSNYFNVKTFSLLRQNLFEKFIWLPDTSWFSLKKWKNPWLLKGVMKSFSIKWKVLKIILLEIEKMNVLNVSCSVASGFGDSELTTEFIVHVVLIYFRLFWLPRWLFFQTQLHTRF